MPANSPHKPSPHTRTAGSLSQQRTLLSSMGTGPTVHSTSTNGWPAYRRTVCVSQSENTCTACTDDGEETHKRVTTSRLTHHDTEGSCNITTAMHVGVTSCTTLPWRATIVTPAVLTGWGSEEFGRKICAIMIGGGIRLGHPHHTTGENQQWPEVYVRRHQTSVSRRRCHQSGGPSGRR